LVPRLSAHHSGKPDYLSDLQGSDDLKSLQEELEYKVLAVMTKVLEYYNAEFDNYSHLWTDDRADFLRQFLLYNHVLTQPEIDKWREENEDKPFPETAPTLEQFKENIDKFRALADKVLEIKDTVVMDQWYRLDVRPFRTALHAVVSKWGYMFIQQMSENISTTVAELRQFISSSQRSLELELEEGDYDGLVNVMGALGTIKHREAETDEVFEPLKERVMLLGTYNVEVPEDVLKTLEQIPEDWMQLKRSVGHPACCSLAAACWPLLAFN
jgi:dynein heavy chain